MRMRFTILTALTLFLLALWGCGPSQRADEFNEKGQLKIVFWHAMGGPLGDVLKGLIQEYNESQGKYYIHPEFMGRYDILEQKIIASVMAGRTPDVAQMYEGVTMLLTRDEGEESLQALNPWVEKWDGWAQIFPAFQENSTYDNGVIYSLPFNKSFPVLMSNREILKLIGKKNPPENWAELASYAKEIHERVGYDKELRKPVLKSQAQNPEDIMGYAFAVDPWLFEVMLLQNGGQMANEEQSEVYFNSEFARESLNWFVKGVQEGWAYRTEGYNHQNEFGAQKVAFIITSSVSQKFMQKKLNFDFAVTPVPSGREREVSIMSGTNVAIFEGIGEARTGGAWDFISWLNSPEITSKWARNTFYVPTRRDALQRPEMQDYYKNVEGASASIDQLEIGDMEPRSSAWYRCRIILRSYMEKVISHIEKGDDENPDSLIKRYLDMATKRMNRELSKYHIKRKSSS